MSTLTAVIFAMWVLPIIGVGIAYVRLSRRYARELAVYTENRAITDAAEARRVVAAPRPTVFDAPLSEEERRSLPSRTELGVSNSGRVNVRALNERRLFAVSSN